MVNLLPHAQLFPVWQLAVWLQACIVSLSVFFVTSSKQVPGSMYKSIVVTLDTKQAVKIVLRQAVILVP